MKVVDTLSRNEGSLDSSEKLEDRLQEIPKYSEPQSCDIYWFTGDSNSFENKGQILLKENGEIEVASSLPLRK